MLVDCVLVIRRGRCQGVDVAPELQSATNPLPGADMRRLVLMIAIVVGLTAPTFAQKAEIEAVNAKWMYFFNKGDFAGVSSRAFSCC
jgi:hypothetical protein